MIWLWKYVDAPARERAFAIIETLAHTDFERVAPPGTYGKAPCLRFADDGAHPIAEQFIAGPAGE